MSVADTIRTRLQALEPLMLDLVDESEQHRGHAGYREGGNTHWRLSIVSPRFAGKPTLARRNLIRGLLSEQMSLPDAVWNRLNWSWVGFFAVMGVLNLYVAYNFSEKIWASFKLFGGIGLMLLFVVAQSAFLAKYVEDKP